MIKDAERAIEVLMHGSIKNLNNAGQIRSKSVRLWLVSHEHWIVNKFSFIPVIIMINDILLRNTLKPKSDKYICVCVCLRAYIHTYVTGV